MTHWLGNLLPGKKKKRKKKVDCDRAARIWEKRDIVKEI